MLGRIEPNEVAQLLCTLPARMDISAWCRCLLSFGQRSTKASRRWRRLCSLHAREDSWRRSEFWLKQRQKSMRPSRAGLPLFTSLVRRGMWRWCDTCSVPHEPQVRIQTKTWPTATMPLGGSEVVFGYHSHGSFPEIGGPQYRSPKYYRPHYRDPQEGTLNLANLHNSNHPDQALYEPSFLFIGHSPFHFILN